MTLLEAIRKLKNEGFTTVTGRGGTWEINRFLEIFEREVRVGREPDPPVRMEPIGTTGAVLLYYSWNTVPKWIVEQP